MIRLLIADDHTMFREAIKGLLADQDDMRIVAEASTHLEAINAMLAHELDVAILDFSMPGGDGIEVITFVKKLHPHLRILVLTMHNEAHVASQALLAGAEGFMTKDAAADQLVAAIHRIYSGNQFVCSAIADQLAQSPSHSMGNQNPHTKLSQREYEVFEMLIAGHTVSDIARELSLSSKTVSTHKTRLLNKLNVKTHLELMQYAMRHNLRPTA